MLHCDDDCDSVDMDVENIDDEAMSSSQITDSADNGDAVDDDNDDDDDEDDEVGSIVMPRCLLNALKKRRHGQSSEVVHFRICLRLPPRFSVVGLLRGNWNALEQRSSVFHMRSQRALMTN